MTDQPLSSKYQTEHEKACTSGLKSSWPWLAWNILETQAPQVTREVRHDHAPDLHELFFPLWEYTPGRQKHTSSQKDTVKSLWRAITCEEVQTIFSHRNSSSFLRVCTVPSILMMYVDIAKMKTTTTFLNCLGVIRRVKLNNIVHFQYIQSPSSHISTCKTHKTLWYVFVAVAVPYR